MNEIKLDSSAIAIKGIIKAIKFFNKLPKLLWEIGSQGLIFMALE